MFNDKEEAESNDLDLKSLIGLKGLKMNQHIVALMKIHNFISDLVIGMYTILYINGCS